MILLLGGTSETVAIAHALVDAGFDVLVSQATGIPLEGTMPAAARRRTGPLSEGEMVALIREHRIRAIVDGTHPYAVHARAAARAAAQKAPCPYYSFLRRPAVEQKDGVLFAENHARAAALACSFGVPVLLTTGSRNLTPYVRASGQAGVSLAVRVLPAEESLAACAAAGIDPAHTIASRGPFSVRENRALLKQFGIGVLVTKDGGAPGGVREKLEAAQKEGCRVIVVKRPQSAEDASFSDVSHLIEALTGQLAGNL